MLSFLSSAYTNVQRFLTKFFRGVFGRSTSSTVLCISVFCHVVFFQLCCVALCCDLLCVVFLSFPCCVALCCVAICCVYCSCLLPVVLRCVVLRFATVFASHFSIIIYLRSSTGRNNSTDRQRLHQYDELDQRHATLVDRPARRSFAFLS